MTSIRVRRGTATAFAVAVLVVLPLAGNTAAQHSSEGGSVTLDGWAEAQLTRVDYSFADDGYLGAARARSEEPKLGSLDGWAQAGSVAVQNEPTLIAMDAWAQAGSVAGPDEPSLIAMDAWAQAGSVAGPDEPSLIAMDAWAEAALTGQPNEPVVAVAPSRGLDDEVVIGIVASIVTALTALGGTVLLFNRRRSHSPAI